MKREKDLVITKLTFFFNCGIGSSNNIRDGFFDVGKLPPDSKLASLEEYCKQEINQKRPILLVNAKPE